MKNTLAVACLAALGFAAGCGGGSGTAPSSTTGSTPNAGQGAATAGVYKGTLTSATTGQAAPVMAMVGTDGRTLWMSADGRVWDGTMPMSGTHFDASLTGHMYLGTTFPDGSTAGAWTMSVDHATGMAGHFAGSGDSGTFSLMLSAMGSRPASLQSLAGVYSRSTWSGYTMTMTIGADGQMIGSDSRGCTINGSVSVPDPARNMYSISATLASCGLVDGQYQGSGTLVDADAMRDWMSAMHPLEQGGHSHGGMDMTGMGGMGGMGGMTWNTVPTGTSNLFMFALANGQNAIMDALAR